MKHKKRKLVNYMADQKHIKQGLEENNKNIETRARNRWWKLCI